MGLEFKPYFAWEDEEQDRHRKCGTPDEKQTTTTTNHSTPVESDISEESSGHGEDEEEQQQQPLPPAERNGLVFVHADGTPPAAPVAAPLGSSSSSGGNAGHGRGELAPALAAVNGERREYAVLGASEEETGIDYKSFFSIVLDYPQFLGQGETKEQAMRQARTLLHYALGAMLLKNETIPAPSTGAELEVHHCRSCFLSLFLAFFRCNNARRVSLIWCVFEKK